MKKKVHLLPNVITAFGLTCGLFVIFKMTMMAPGEVTIRQLNEIAAILILAAFADLLDGAVARAMKAQSEFGGLFDSLADAITFGVAPSIIILKSLSAPVGSELSFFLTTAAMIYTVCGVLRLVRFNLISRSVSSTTDQSAILEKDKNFTGLPIPAAASAAVSANLFLASDDFKTFFFLKSHGERMDFIFCHDCNWIFYDKSLEIPQLKKFTYSCGNISSRIFNGYCCSFHHLWSLNSLCNSFLWFVLVIYCHCMGPFHRAHDCR